jgi:hypothetical protein
MISKKHIKIFSYAVSLLLICFACIENAASQTRENYQSCVLNRISSMRETNPRAIAAIKQLCASMFAYDITNHISGKLTAISVSGVGYWTFQNTSNFHITAICVDIKSKSNNSSSTYCGTITEMDILQQTSDGTIAPYSTGRIKISFEGQGRPNFWVDHTYLVVNIRGFD